MISLKIRLSTIRFLIGTLIISSLFVISGCEDKQSNNSSTPQSSEITNPSFQKTAQIEEPLRLTEESASKLIQLPLDCVQTEYPNKLGQVLKNAEDLKSPKELHPAFYGCFDWHSSVHGHWSLVALLKQFPDIEKADEAMSRLSENMSAKNIAQEVIYFKNDKAYERTYGWAWLLKLAEELHTWDTPYARELENNLQPLTDLIVARYIEFLPKLIYPIRVGEHTNTGFGLTFAWDYAETSGHEELKKLIDSRAKDYYLNDKNYSMVWEPSGFDFLSPGFEEIDLMSRVLDENSFSKWLTEFMPSLKSVDFDIDVAQVSTRNDGKLVHLDGLNFSRAWVMYGLANRSPEFNHLTKLANKHMEHSLGSLIGDSYEGSHWLGSFAIYALQTN